jgi:hypothetical protein
MYVKEPAIFFLVLLRVWDPGFITDFVGREGSTIASNQELGDRNSTRTRKNEEQRRVFALCKRSAFLFFFLPFIMQSHN